MQTGNSSARSRAGRKATHVAKINSSLVPRRVARWRRPGNSSHNHPRPYARGGHEEQAFHEIGLGLDVLSKLYKYLNLKFCARDVSKNIPQEKNIPHKKNG